MSGSRGTELPLWFAVLLGFVVVAATSRATAAEIDRAGKEYFAAHCNACHDGATKLGALDLTVLDWNTADPQNADRWTRVIDRVSAGEMPPKDEPRPPEEQTKSLIKAWSEQLRSEQLRRYADDGRSQRRRLNRVEYENTLRDLLGTPDLRVAELLPDDGTAYGFDTVDSALTLSPVQVEKYLQATDRALDVALGVGKPPEYKQVHYSFLDDPKRKKQLAEPHQVRVLPDALAFFVSTGEYHPFDVSEFRAPAPGRYRIRISGYGWKTEGKPVVVRLYGGNFGVGGKTNLIGYYELPADKATVVELEAYLESRNDGLKTIPFGLPGGWQKNSSQHEGPAVAIQWIEVEGPLEAKEWPPKSRAALWGDVDPQQTTVAEAKEVVRRFAQRAFRRPTGDEDLGPYLQFVEARLREGATWEQAIRAGLKALLVSPRFLQLDSEPGPLDGYALASRLSYFLWSTMPDEELLAAARRGELGRAEVLRTQVERMLADPRARAFTENFAGQWLGLRNIDFTVPDARLYPEFDEWLKVSMVRETSAFFDEILRSDQSVTNFVHSDFAMLNERLAQHYGIPDVHGLDIRRVALRPEWHRGGVLTQGSVLKVTANGTNTSPVVRGAWVRERILGEPVPPPPGNVPAIEPDIRGASTIREQLNKHKQVELCATCHKLIDPPGYALENYDVIGGLRDRYRISPEKGQKADLIEVATTSTPRKVAVGPTVDAADQLPDGSRFRNLDEFKQLVLRHPANIARGLTEKLVVYGTGHRLEFADRTEIERIVAQADAKQYGLRSLVHAVVQSPLFLQK
jgi:mono/diheme cytochrome c family protein